jgi:hypothetical protein
VDRSEGEEDGEGDISRDGSDDRVGVGVEVPAGTDREKRGDALTVTDPKTEGDTFAVSEWEWLCAVDGELIVDCEPVCVTAPVGLETSDCASLLVSVKEKRAEGDTRCECEIRGEAEGERDGDKLDVIDA